MAKIIFITGASSGIGKAVGLYLQEKGYTIYGTSRNPEKYNSKFPLFSLDVRNVDSIQKAIAEVIDKEGKIDVLINNAGVGITGALEELSAQEIKNNFETNFFGPIEVIKTILPYMRQNGGGRIINITSIAGYMGLPFRSVYSASKGALELITEALRMEVMEFNIKISNVAPGDFATDIASRRFHAPLNKNSPYFRIYKQQLETINSHVDLGSDPLEMARAIEKIITSKNPKIHYKIGAFMQKFSIVLKRVLPDLWYEKMLKNHYKIN